MKFIDQFKGDDMLRTGLVLMLIFSFFTSQITPAFANGNQTKEEKKMLKIKEKIKKLGIGEKAKVNVRLYNKDSFQGYLNEANEDNLVVVTNDGNSKTVKYSEIDSIVGKNLSTGNKLAIGVGFGIGIAILVALLVVRYGVNE